MKNRSYGRLSSVVVGVLTLVITISALFSLAQQLPSVPFPLPIPGSPIDLLADVTNRVLHPACPHCFKVADTYGIHEEVPGTAVIILREIPDPAPLAPGELRPEFDNEGEPIWYVGHQGIVGPTDEEPVSEEIPLPKIELRRIQARQMDAVFSIPGVHGFGINAHGFIVSLEPEHLENESRIAAMLEGIPVEVEVAHISVLRADISDLYRRPVEIGVGILAVEENGIPIGGGGTLGPHIVRDEVQPGIPCCQIWSLTASHVIKAFNNTSPPQPGIRRVYQPSNNSSGNLWGYVAHSWAQTPCDTLLDPNCASANAPVNFTDRNPDVAAIAHIQLLHNDPDIDPVTGKSIYKATGNEPIRRMKYGRSTSSYVSGPSGLIRTPGIGTKVKMWGSRTSADNAASVIAIDRMIIVDETPDGGRKYKYCCVDEVALLSRGGDSGALIAYDGTGERHVAGVLFAGRFDAQNKPIVGSHFTKAFDIQSAFINAGKGFHYYWGTKDNHRRPASTQCDGGC